MGAQVRQMRRETRCEECEASREVGGLEQPGEQKSSVRIRGQWNRVEYDRSSNLELLINGDVLAFKTCPHTPCAEPALGDLPETVDHRVEDEVVGGGPESEAASTAML